MKQLIALAAVAVFAAGCGTADTGTPYREFAAEVAGYAQSVTSIMIRAEDAASTGDLATVKVEAEKIRSHSLLLVRWLESHPAQACYSRAHAATYDAINGLAIAYGLLAEGRKEAALSIKSAGTAGQLSSDLQRQAATACAP